EDLQSADRRGDDDEDEGGAQRGQGDGGELAETACAVDGRGFVVVAGDGLHGGEQDERVVAGPAEVDHGGDGDMAPERVFVPGDRGQAEVGEGVVDETVVVAEQVGEDECHGNGSHHVGQQHPHAPERLGTDV